MDKGVNHNFLDETYEEQKLKLWQEICKALALRKKILKKKPKKFYRWLKEASAIERRFLAIYASNWAWGLMFGKAIRVGK